MAVEVTEQALAVPVAFDDRLEVVEGTLRGADERFEIDVNEAEAELVALGSFEIVEKRPEEVPADVDPFPDRAFHHCKMPAEIAAAI